MKQYDISKSSDIAELERQANFNYIDRYQCQSGKRFKRIFKHPAFKKFLKKYEHPDILVAPIALLGKKGFGVVAAKDIKIPKKKETQPLGIYWGKLLLEASPNSSYIFMVSKYEIDANKHGNWTRFVNHSKGNYNVIAVQKSFNLGKLRLPYIEYALLEDVKAGDQLLVDYGPDYEFDPKHQLFLNPSNNALNVKEFYQQHRKVYKNIKLANNKKLLVPKYAHVNDFPILELDNQGKLLRDHLQQGVTLLMVAAYEGDTKQIRELLKNERVNINQENIKTGYNALFYAIHSKVSLAKQMNAVKLLLDAGIRIETQDKDGYTALHWCIKRNNLPLLKLIFTNKNSKEEASEALKIKDRKNLTPYQLAMADKNLDIALYLKKQKNKRG